MAIFNSKLLVYQRGKNHQPANNDSPFEHRFEWGATEETDKVDDRGLSCFQTCEGVSFPHGRCDPYPLVI